MQSVSEVADKWRLLREGLDRVIMGQESVKEQLLVCLLAGGHALLEGVPGHGQDAAGAHAGAPPRLPLPPHPVHART